MYIAAVQEARTAGGTNLADLLTEPEGDAGASPLFKWTSDGSMMEELMKVYKYAFIMQPDMCTCVVNLCS